MLPSVQTAVCAVHVWGRNGTACNYVTNISTQELKSSWIVTCVCKKNHRIWHGQGAHCTRCRACSHIPSAWPTSHQLTMANYVMPLPHA